MTDATPPTTPSPASAPGPTAFLIDGMRWFDLDLSDRPHPDAGTGRVPKVARMVASVCVDLAAEGLLTTQERRHGLDPVATLALERWPSGYMTYFCDGECDLGSRLDTDPVLRALGAAAVAGGAISEHEWDAFLADEGFEED